MKFHTTAIQMPCEPGSGRVIHRFVWRKNTSGIAIIIFGKAAVFISVTPRELARDYYKTRLKEGGIECGDPTEIHDSATIAPIRSEVLKALNKLVNSP